MHNRRTLGNDARMRSASISSRAPPAERKLLENRSGLTRCARHCRDAAPAPQKQKSPPNRVGRNIVTLLLRFVAGWPPLLSAIARRFVGAGVHSDETLPDAFVFGVVDPVEAALSGAASSLKRPSSSSSLDERAPPDPLMYELP